MFNIKKSLLLVIDVQGHLAYKMHDKDNLFRNLQKIIKAAQILEIPVIYTEQAPDKIGKTVPEIAQHLAGQQPIVKATFSCGGEPVFWKALKKTKRKEIIVCGIETHVCLYQTVVDLLNKKFKVQAVVDAISSRTLENKQIAIEKINSMGAELTSCEMLVTELMRTSKHPRFREILSLIR